MRDLHSLSSEKILRDLESNLSQYISKRSNLFTTPVVNNPNFHYGESRFALKKLSSKELAFLTIASWYLGDLGLYLRLDLEEELEKRELEDNYKIIADICIESRAHSEIFILETKLWHSRDFYGNILPDIIRTLNALRFVNPSVKVKTPQRKRGYHDKGSRALDPHWKYARDYSQDTRDFYERETQKLTFKQTTLLISGLLA